MRASLLLFSLVAVQSGFGAAFVHRQRARKSSSRLLMSVPNAFDTLTSGLASVVRLPHGVTVSDVAKTPEDRGDFRLLVLYDVENSRECRAVRERITELDLVVERVVPATENSRVFVEPSNEFALHFGTRIPRLVLTDDEDEKVVDGDDIVPFLDKKFAKGSNKGGAASSYVEVGLKEKVLSVLNEVGSYAATFLRLGRGTKVCPAAAAGSLVPRPSKAIILYSYEGNQFCRLVREVLTELDIPYELRSAGKESPRRAQMAEISGGSTQCPYMIDENSGVKMFESAEIIRYLYKTYALWTPPNEVLEVVSSVVTPLLKPVYNYLTPLQAGSNGDREEYKRIIADAKQQIETEVSSASVVVYTYSLSPFCTEATALLDNLDVNYKEISLGKEWVPGFISEEGARKRAALGEMTDQTSLPHVFIGGKSIGGLFSGNPGLVPSMEQGELLELVNEARK